MSAFKFELDDTIIVGNDGDTTEQGQVIGRAEYSRSENSYYVRYRNGQGVFAEAWFAESALTSPFE